MISQNNQTTEPLFYWELETTDNKISVTEKQMNQILNAEERGIKMVKIGDNIINLAFVKNIKKVFKEEQKFAKDYLDWATMGQKVVSDEKAISNRQKMMDDIKKMLKQKNKEWKPVYKDPIHKEAVADVWLHLKSLITTLEFPIKDDSWKLDPSITTHKDGSETHPVAYYTKGIDLGDKYDDKFWCEASYIFCNACKKEIKKQIVIFNGYESDAFIREM